MLNIIFPKASFTTLEIITMLELGMSLCMLVLPKVCWTRKEVVAYVMGGILDAR